MVRRRRRLRLTGTLIVGLAVATFAACGGPDKPGSVGGFLPPCYGPGPDLNLTPTRVVEVYQDGNLVKRQAFRSDGNHKTYEIELPPGRYEVKGPGIEPIPVRIESGHRVTVDLPLPPCA
jgi:hypothetical protein